MKKEKSMLIVILAIVFVVVFATTTFAATSLRTDTTKTEASPAYISSNPPGPGYTGWCTVTAQPSLTARSGPGTNYSPVTSELYGNYVDVVFVNNTGWAEISIGSNSTGWVSTSYLTIGC
ncbi:bacterial SH3 domain protein [Peptococcaceae bacterium CEB3]|nr:bacterial SH3 domain protein [Peptococcaceae bacterium CEB3]